MARDSEKSEIESALVDAELFLKYRMPDRAISALLEAVNMYPSNTDLRLHLAEICIEQRRLQDAAEQLVAVANIYIESNQPQFARSALIKVKEIFPNIEQIDAWLESIDQFQKKKEAPALIKSRPKSTLSGDLSYISLFDVIQTVEKNRITGIIYVESGETTGSIYFNKGLIADAVLAELRGKAAFKRFAEINEGKFHLAKSPVEFHSSISAISNAQLILEMFADDDAIETEEA